MALRRARPRLRENPQGANGEGLYNDHGQGWPATGLKMIDLTVRKSLSQDIRRLVTGRMTNDEFDDAYYGVYEKCGDRTVRKIASFCYGLYSSDLLFPMRLRGRHAVSKETRSAAARAVLFLRSGLEYAWPDIPDSLALRCLRGLAIPLGISSGIVLSLIGIPVFLSEPYLETGFVALFGLLLVAGSVAVVLKWRSFVHERWVCYRASGDYDVWPFLRQEDLEQARQSRHLLGH